jgi:hypothetical protein
LTQAPTTRLFGASLQKENVMQSRLLSAAVVALIAAPLAAQADPDRTVAGGGSFPSGWNVRTETSRQTGQPAPLANVKFQTMGAAGDLHTTVGPAAIYWRDRDTVSGNYHVVAKMIQMKNPAHPEAFGLVIGGRNLADSAQRYTYFLVRPTDGKFSIRRRASYAARPTAVVEWTDSDAVVKGDSGEAANELSIEVKSGRARFMINGKEVYAGSAADLDVNGVVGYRVNHNLDVHLGPLGIHKL